MNFSVFYGRYNKEPEVWSIYWLRFLIDKIAFLVVHWFFQYKCIYVDVYLIMQICLVMCTVLSIQVPVLNI